VPESYLLGDRSLYIDGCMKVRQAISPDGYFPPGGPDTALRTVKAFEPSLADKQIDLSEDLQQFLRAKANAIQVARHTVHEPVQKRTPMPGNGHLRIFGSRGTPLSTVSSTGLQQPAPP
jgi:hypothetical protein